MNVAVIGLGILGDAMTRSLLGNGYKVTVNNRTRAKADPLLEAGAVWANTPGDASKNADAVITFVTDPKAVRAVCLGANGILESLRNDAVHCEMSTVTPDAAKDMAHIYANSGKKFVQAPVLGSKSQIKNGELIVFAGGKDCVELAERAWAPAAKRTYWLDTAAESAALKLSCNMLLAHMIVGLGQSMVFAREHGVSGELLLDVLEGSALGAPMFAAKGRSILERKFEPNFIVSNMLKDLGLIASAAETAAIPVPFSALTREMFVAAVAQGVGDEDYSAVVKVLERLAAHD